MTDKKIRETMKIKEKMSLKQRAQDFTLLMMTILAITFALGFLTWTSYSSSMWEICIGGAGYTKNLTIINKCDEILRD